MRIPTALLLIGQFMLVGLTFLSCTGDVCGDIWDRSPAQLLNDNQFLLLAKVDQIDTLLALGPMEYLDNESSFLALSYTFSSLQDMQLQGDTVPRYLWICERNRVSHSAVTYFEVGDTILIYGDPIRNNDDLFLILSPIAPQDDLARILSGVEPELDWNTRVTDSTLAAAIVSADPLQQKLVDIHQRGEIVLYCPEEFCLTMKDFRQGKLCYYDSLGVGHRTTSSEYLRVLSDIASR